MKLTKFQRSQKAHLRLADYYSKKYWNNPPLRKKKDYHETVWIKQLNRNRLLTKSEKQSVWNDVSKKTFV